MVCPNNELRSLNEFIKIRSASNFENDNYVHNKSNCREITEVTNTILLDEEHIKL